MQFVELDDETCIALIGTGLVALASGAVAQVLYLAAVPCFLVKSARQRGRRGRAE